MTDWIDALERLTMLHQNGALTDAEFAEQKARILDQQAAAGSASASSHHSAAETPAATGVRLSWVLAGLMGAALLGVLLWWSMVDNSGVVKPVAIGSAGASPAAVEQPSAGASAAAAAAQPAVTATATAMPSAAGMDAAAPTPVSAKAFSPSFSCAGELDDVLKLICGSRELSRKDRLLSERFKAVLRGLEPVDQQTLLRRQREFLRERAACEDTTCLNDWYDRVNEFYL